MTMRLNAKIVAFALFVWSFPFGAMAQINDISLTAGVNVPMYKGVESDAVLNVSYGRFHYNGLGFRAGFQWSPSVADVDNAFGIPLAFSYKTRSKGTRERLLSAAEGSIDSAVGRGYADSGDAASGLIGGFLLNLFSDMEFFAGITPGYVAGQSSVKSRTAWGDSWRYWEEAWTERRNSFSMTVDAGMCLNYSVWRFDIKIMPAFHYDLTGNLAYHKTMGEKGVGVKTTESTTLRCFFTLGGGLAFNF